MLGSGTYGNVWKTKDGTVVKKYKRKLCATAIREIMGLRRFSHLHIIPLLASDVSAATVSITMTAADMNLDDLMHGSTPLPQVKKIVFGVLDGLKALHGTGWVHGDLNPYNILIKNGEAMLGDFGSLQRPSLGSQTTTIPWSAPEWITKSKHSYATDMWSLGVVLYEWLSGEPLWPEEVADNMTLRKYHSALGEVDAMAAECYKLLPVEEKEGWRELVKGLLNKDEEERWTVGKALSSPLFSSFSCSAYFYKEEVCIPPIDITMTAEKKKAVLYVQQCLKGKFPCPAGCEEEIVEVLQWYT